MSTNGRLFWRNTDDIDPISVLEALAREQGDAWEARQFAALWKETARRAISDRDFANMASQSFRKVAEEHYERALKAEENVWAREEMINRLAARALKAEQERDRWQEVAEVNQEELDHLHSDTPRPLTADDITDEMLERAERFAGSWGNVPSRFPWRALLTAALTEPPSRPEGAEDLETVIGLSAGKWTTGAEDVRALADLLASRGVRVTGGK